MRAPHITFGKFGRWLEDGRGARKSGIKLGCMGRGVETCPACCQERFSGRRGLSWGTTPKCLLSPSGVMQPGEVAPRSLSLGPSHLGCYRLFLQRRNFSPVSLFFILFILCPHPDLLPYTFFALFFFSSLKCT